MTLRPNAVCSHIIVDSNTGKANGVAFVNQRTKQAYEVYGKVVVLCASTLESTRLLLNSQRGNIRTGWPTIRRACWDNT